jgi:glycerol kinase
LFGLTRDTGPAELARAALEAVCYQTHDLFRAMAEDGLRPQSLRVDGGMVINNWLTQFLADILGVSVERPEQIETTALGAAMLAALQLGLFDSLDEMADAWRLETRFEPSMDASLREQLLTGWDSAVASLCSR